MIESDSPPFHLPPVVPSPTPTEEAPSGGFIYFVPGDHAPAAETLAALGILGRVHPGAVAHPTRVSPAGPGGAAGFTLPGPSDERRAFKPAEQEWREAPGGGYWIGWWKSRRPTPESLAKPRGGRPGHLVRLADGRDWLIPVARHFDGTCGVPRRLRLNAKYEWELADPIPGYESLVAGAERAYRHIRAEMGESGEGAALLTEEEAIGLAVEGLATNYDIGPAECSALGLFDTGNVLEAALALADWPRIKQGLIALAQRLGKERDAIDAAAAPAAVA